MTWRVLRHSARGGGPESNGWRLVYEGDEQTARGRYGALYVAMRQGGIRLVKQTGEVEREYHAPRLRTRW